MSRDFWIAIRQAVLLVVDILERELGIAPLTGELRKEMKRLRRELENVRDKQP